jgi:membrane protease subunit HflC
MIGKRQNLSQHWPVIALALVVVGIFTAAIVKTLGRPKEVDGQVRIYGPGLHLKWPIIDEVWSHDNRLQCYQLTKGRVEQITTSDDYQIVVSTYVLWRVGDPALFLKRVNTTEDAEDRLDAVVRNSRNNVLPRHRLSELINVDPGESKLADIEQEMLRDLKDTALKEYGIEVTYLGFKHLGFPEKVSTKVFDRMRAERSRKSQKYLAEGAREAQRIRAEADRKVSDIRAQAEADSKRIRGDGDEQAAKHYAVFQANPELAAFLRKLDSLRLTLSEKTTLIVDTTTPPYDLLLPGATDLPNQGKDQAAEAQEKKAAGSQ